MHLIKVFNFLGCILVVGNYMFYSVKYTMPTLKIKTVENYKTRINEILSWQIKDTLQSKWIVFASLFQSKTLDDVLLCLGFMLLSIITLPFMLLYVVLCLTELFLDTLFFPLFLVPVVRIIPTVIVVIVWALSFCIGLFACAMLQR